MTVFRPSAQLLIRVRIDEGTQTAPLEARLRGPTTQALAPTVPSGAPAATPATEIENLTAQIRYVERANPDTFDGGATTKAEMLRGLREQLAAAQGRLTSLGDEGSPDGCQQVPPTAVEGLAPDDRFIRGGILPISVEVERNGYRTADTAKITIPWIDAPFDPRLVRSCAVEMVIGTVSADDYEAGIRGETDDRGALRSVVRQNPAGSIVGGATRFVGFVDDWTVQFDGEEGDTITLECRDVTALFLDTPLPASTTIDLTKPLDIGVREWLAQFPTLSRICVVYGDVGDPAPGDPPVPSIAMGIPPQRMARRGRVVRAQRSGDQKMTLWDHLSDVCQQLGHTPIVRDYELRIVRSRTFFTREMRPRRMVYGRNLEALEFTRKLGGVKVPTIEVRCYDPVLGRTRWARHPTRPADIAAGILGVVNPPPALRANEVTPSGENPDERIQTYTVRNITDPVALVNVARAIYDQIGRQEIEGAFRTSEVDSWESVSPGDLLTMQSGDAVELLVASSIPGASTDTLSTVARIESLGRRARTAYLLSLGWSEAVAARFATLQDAVGFQTIFRVQDATIRFDSDQGIQVQCNFINFIEVREASPIASTAPAALDETSPSAEALARTRGSRSEEARALRRSAQLRRILTSWRESGVISQEAYDHQIAELQDVEHDRVRALDASEGGR